MSYRSSSRLHRAVTACTAAAVFGLLCVAPARVSAQWVHYPTSGIPRTKDGTPNLKAATPRTRDGHPDLSGIWYATDARSSIDVSQMPPDLLVEALKAQGAPRAPGPVTDAPCVNACISEEEFGVDGVNIGRSLPDKTLPYQPWARKAVLQHMIANAK